jgi:hypothetical protein
MNQVVFTSPGEVFVRDAPMPRLSGSGAIVETVCSVLGAGTELGHMRRRREAARSAPPTGGEAVGARPMSYQSCGVRDVGGCW